MACGDFGRTYSGDVQGHKGFRVRPADAVREIDGVDGDPADGFGRRQTLAVSPPASQRLP